MPTWAGIAEQRQHVLVWAVTTPSRAEPFGVCGVRCEVGIDAALDVHVLPAREPLRNQHHLGQLAAQVTGDPQRQPGQTRLPTQRLRRELEQPVGFQKSATGPDMGFYAARSYWLRRPPRTGRCLIRSWERPAPG